MSMCKSRCSIIYKMLHKMPPLASTCLYSFVWIIFTSEYDFARYKKSWKFINLRIYIQICFSLKKYECIKRCYMKVNKGYLLICYNLLKRVCLLFDLRFPCLMNYNICEYTDICIWKEDELQNISLYSFVFLFPISKVLCNNLL